MPAPIIANGLGALGGVDLEYVTTGGNVTKRGIATSAAVGAIPGVGMGVGGAIRLGTKLGKIHTYAHRIKKYDDLKTLGMATVVPGSRVYLGGSAYAIASGAAANYVVGMAYDRITHSSSGTRAPRQGATTQSSRRHGPYSSHRSRRSASSGRRRKRCTHRDRRGRRCLRPAGHSGRHRYQ